MLVKLQPATVVNSRRGNALLMILLIMVLMTGLAGAALTLTSSSVREIESERNRIQALYLAEAGIAAGLGQLAVSYNSGATVAANVGTLDAPVQLHANTYWTTLTENLDGTFTIRATGTAGGSSRTIEATAESIPASPFDHAVYAGNLQDDPVYQLTFGGKEGQADAVTGGDIYSGGDILINDDATVTGGLRAHGDVLGATGQGGAIMDVPKILDIDYTSFNDFDVADLFTAATRLSDDAGGTAGQLPSTSPAHFFRKNPDDRSSDIDATTKDDYFLEDPYESIGVDSGQDGSDAFDITIPVEANNRVFYIDGNLWIHNRKSYSMKIKNEGLDPTRVTFVVNGNVYFSDNLFYDDPSMDGVAFIALADENVADSGNIYFGDPVFGTMRFAESLMFAENNFYDNNLDADGSTKVEIRGNMTAGNQVAINRDFVKENGETAHTKLDLKFDPRQANGLLDMPGVPVSADHPSGYSVVAWREVSVPPTSAVPSATVKADSPADAPSVDSPFKDNIDPTSDDAAQSNDWRKRWSYKYGDAWKKSSRKGKWSDRIAPRY